MFQQVRSSEEVRAWFDRHGVTVTQWAQAHGFAPAVVYSVLAGRCRGRRGQAYRAAVALGLRMGAQPGEPSPLSTQPDAGAGPVERRSGGCSDAPNRKEATMT